MTDRVAGFVVTLEQNHRYDDVQEILNAISMIKGVVAVEPVVNSPNVQIAETRVRHEIIGKIGQMVKTL